MRLALFFLLLASCSRTPDEPNPVVKEMRPMPGKTSVEVAPAPLSTALPQPAPTCPPDPKPSEIATLYGHGDLSFVTPDGKDHKFKVEIAKTEDAQQRGLMYRTSLAEDAGMIFVFPDPHPATFWMHNTCIPLDMLYVTKEGIIAGILEQVPTLNDAPRGIKCPVAHVLELNAGWARAHGIAPGMKLKIEG